MARYFGLGGGSPYLAVLDAAVIVLVLVGVDQMPGHRRHWLDLLVYALLSFVMVATAIYISFYAQLMDPKMLEMVGQLGTVGGAIGQLIKPIYVLFFADIPLLAIWVWWLHRTRTPQQRPARSRFALALLAAAAVVFGVQVFLVLRLPSYIDGVAVARSRGLAAAEVAVLFPRDEDTSADFNVTTIDQAGATTATATPVSASTTSAPLTRAAALQQRIDSIRGDAGGSRIATFSAGAYKGKNIIVIQVEALNTMLMNEKIDGKEITPNLNRIAGESWYWPDTYSETGLGNTADAEFIVNSSLYAPKDQAASVAYAPKKFPALPRLLHTTMGYEAVTLHQNRVEYWNRKELYSALGFNKYYDAPFFHWADMLGPMGSSDEVLFKKGMEVLQSLDASDTPFLATFVTLSSHTPFDLIPQSRRPVKTPSEYVGSLMGDYISAESYSDYAIGKFVKDLKKKGIWDDSIVVIYGDHTSMNDNTLSGEDAAAAKALLGRDYTAADRQRIPLIIHLPGQTEGVVGTSTAGQVDIMPTIADLVALDISQAPHMGRSLFTTGPELVPLRSYLPGGSFVNDNVVFMPGMGFDDGTALKISDGSKVKATDAEKKDFQRMLDLTRISASWASSLPTRGNAGDLADSWIPNAAAREQAAPLGAKQTGTGSN